MYPVKFYRDKRGKEPVAKWLDEVFKSDAAGASKIDDRIQKLRKYGLELLATNIMKRLSVADSHLYELIPGAYRVIVYHDTKQSKFILLHGFRKKRQRQDKDIDRAKLRLKDYLLSARQEQRGK